MSPQYRGCIRLFLLAIFDVLVILGIQRQIKGKIVGHTLYSGHWMVISEYMFMVIGMWLNNQPVY